MDMHCIVCGTELKPCFDGMPIPPLGATVFHAYGNYGSEVFDRMSFHDNDTYLEICICDACLRRKAELVIYCERKVTKEVKERPFGAVLAERIMP
jgi:hypothetical protein